MHHIETNNIIPFLDAKDDRYTVLSVDDDNFELGLANDQIRQMGHTVVEATNGREALEILHSHKDRIDVVLMDMIMPAMDGLETIYKMREDPNLRLIPVIMLTTIAKPKAIQDGIEAGVFYYLSKPIEPEIFCSVLTAALAESSKTRTLNEELKKHRSSFAHIHTCKFHFKTVAEAENLATFMALCFPEPERVVAGLAELMVNAIEHGNLEIGYNLKTELLKSGTLKAEIDRRLNDKDYKDRFVEVIITRKDNGVYAIVTDQGKGFEWKRYINIDAARSDDNHGRGIAQAGAISFDKLTYNAQGTQAIAYVGSEKDLEW